jgi:hypothetical protein
MLISMKGFSCFRRSVYASRKHLQLLINEMSSLLRGYLVFCPDCVFRYETSVLIIPLK